MGKREALPYAIEPGQPLAPGVHIKITTRAAPGVSSGVFARCNLGARVGDAPEAVAANRAGLRAVLDLPSSPCFLRQVHGREVIRLSKPPAEGEAEPEADAAWTDQRGVVLAVLSADCVPILLAAEDGSLVAVAHAGWRGLALGVIRALLDHIPLAPSRLRAFIGPAISAAGYEVGPEVLNALVHRDPRHAECFRQNERGRHQLDLRLAACQQLQAAGVAAIAIAPHDTDREPELWYSHRRDRGNTGRFASLIWIAP